MQSKQSAVDVANLTIAVYSRGLTEKMMSNEVVWIAVHDGIFRVEVGRWPCIEGFYTLMSSSDSCNYSC